MFQGLLATQYGQCRIKYSYVLAEQSGDKEMADLTEYNDEEGIPLRYQLIQIDHLCQE